ncbi:MAG: DUF2891 domain-containing protein [Lewinellaceae bacterium]|nr:DUF2891 domain-containing protein [Saprospiraceae bacterium]MCB9311959.1 DUF2891 domain-containing protein [Lewinellaceae bacterium]HRW76089.1 DUF2891 domain-containing protein [Saprospiraceae bacterium]
MYLFFLILFSLPGHIGHSVQPAPHSPDHMLMSDTLPLDMAQASRLAALPVRCLQTEFPNKLNQVLGSEQEMGTPRQLHPAFFGCFDWHSSVHGHWMLVATLRRFPDLPEADQIRPLVQSTLSAENLAGELAYFQRASEKSFERTYGWAWLLRLSMELQQWEDPLGQELAANLEPLTRLIVGKYKDYLPRLVYPIRTGEHPNTAFGLSHAWDFASFTGDSVLMDLIETHAYRFFATDRDGPLSWEPSGYDFLSPCLEEADLMRRIMPVDMFRPWLRGFLPGLADPAFTLTPGEVRDRTDGKLVHLDGLNFSRAWCLYDLARSLPEYGHLRQIADQHMASSLPRMTDGAYEGEHWLASFAWLALTRAFPDKS